MKLWAFDLEIADDPGDDWSPERDLGVTCAAACNERGDVMLWWAGGFSEIDGFADLGEDARRMAIQEELAMFAIGERMTPHEAKQVLLDLEKLGSTPAEIVSWNGLKFDFHVLGVEAGDVPLAARLALHHVDLMFAVLSDKGYPVGLARAAKAIGSHKGAGGVSNGAQAPALWKEGRYVEVLMYLAQDTIATRDVALALQRSGKLRWLTTRGRIESARFPSLSLVRVKDVLEYPEPNQSWMSHPIDRHDCYAWAKEYWGGFA